MSTHVQAAFLCQHVTPSPPIGRVLKGGDPTALDEDGDVFFGGPLTAAKRRHDQTHQAPVATPLSRVHEAEPRLQIDLAWALSSTGHLDHCTFHVLCARKARKP